MHTNHSSVQPKEVAVFQSGHRAGKQGARRNTLTVYFAWISQDLLHTDGGNTHKRFAKALESSLAEAMADANLDDDDEETWEPKVLETKDSEADRSTPSSDTLISLGTKFE